MFGTYTTNDTDNVENLLRCHFAVQASKDCLVGTVFWKVADALAVFGGNRSPVWKRRGARTQSLEWLHCRQHRHSQTKAN